MKRSIITFVLLWLWTWTIHAAPLAPRAFVPGSMSEIAAAYDGKPFILAFWSTSCVHCKANLALFGRLLRQHPNLPLVLVSTDSPEENPAIAAILATHQLGDLQSWVFSDPFVERLYFEIDRRWHGELPRTYLYDAAHRARAVTGKLDETETARWVQALP